MFCKTSKEKMSRPLKHFIALSKNSFSKFRILEIFVNSTLLAHGILLLGDFRLQKWKYSLHQRKIGSVHAKMYGSCTYLIPDHQHYKKENLSILNILLRRHQKYF